MIPGDGPRRYPLLEPARDPRFSLALLGQLSDLLVRHGYPAPAGPQDWIHLQTGLRDVLYGSPARVRWRCARCDQPVRPGAPAPWCLGGAYRCDPSRAVRVPVPTEQPAGLFGVLPAQEPVRGNGPDRSGDRTGLAPDRSGRGPDRSGTRTDDELLEVLAESEVEHGPVTSRKDVERRTGVGAGRAERLLARFVADGVGMAAR